jgi:hypothetical protein
MNPYYVRTYLIRWMVTAKLERSCLSCWKVWNPLWFHGLPGLYGIKYIGYLLRQMILTGTRVWATHAMEIKMARRCWKAHTCDEGVHCIWDMTLSHVTKVEKIKTRLGSMDRLHVWMASWVMTWHRWTETTVKSKWSQGRWTNTVMWWYEVDHIICDLVSACVASTLEEMECNAQGKGLFIGYFTSPVISV